MTQAKITPSNPKLRFNNIMAVAYFIPYPKVVEIESSLNFCKPVRTDDKKGKKTIAKTSRANISNSDWYVNEPKS